jgi:cell division protein DivIC
MKNKRIRIGNILVTVAVLAVSGFFLYVAGVDILSTLKLTNQVKDSQNLIEKLEVENKQLVNQKNKLQDPEYVKSYARGAYMLSKNGEQIFQISGDD